MLHIPYDRNYMICTLIGIFSTIFLCAVLTPFQGIHVVTNLSLHLLPKEKPAEPVIVCIDDQSLKKYGPWPWPRRVVSRLVDAISSAQPKAVGLDILFVERTQDDALLASSLKKAGHVCLAEYLNLHSRNAWGKNHVSRGTFEEPVPELKKNAADVGFIDVFSTPDDAIRTMPLRYKNQVAFVASIIKTAYPGFKLRRDEVILRIAANPQNFLHIPAIRVLEGHGKAQLKGHIVIVGVTATGVSDRYMTSASSLGRIPGIYLHAYTLANLLQWGSLTLVPTTAILVLTILLIGCLGIQPFNTGLKMSIGAIVAIFLTSIIAYNQGFWFSPFHPTLAILATLFVRWLWFTFDLQIEKSRAQEYLRKYLSPLVLEQLAAGSESQTSEVKDLTVVFVDLRGYTGMAESTSPSHVASILNQLLGTMADIIIANDGMIDKFTGDGILAFFRSVPQERQTRSAVKAAFEIQRSYRANRYLGIGIGIATGPVSIGSIGSRERRDFTIVGDTVNVAARLEKIARPGMIVIDEKTARAANIDGIFRSIRVTGRRQFVQTIHLSKEDEAIYSMLKEADADEP